MSDRLLRGLNYPSFLCNTFWSRSRLGRGWGGGTPRNSGESAAITSPIVLGTGGNPSGIMRDNSSATILVTWSNDIIVFTFASSESQVVGLVRVHHRAHRSAFQGFSANGVFASQAPDPASIAADTSASTRARCHPSACRSVGPSSILPPTL